MEPIPDTAVVSECDGDFAEEPVRISDAAWAGFSAQYFVSLGLPANGTVPVAMETVSTGLKDDENKPERMLVVELGEAGKQTAS